MVSYFKGISEHFLEFDIAELKAKVEGRGSDLRVVAISIEL